MVLWIADSSACLPARQTTSEMWEKLHNRRSSTLSSHCVPALHTRGRGRNVFCDSKTLKDALFQRCTGHACYEHSRWPLSRATGELYVPACVLTVPGAQSSEKPRLNKSSHRRSSVAAPLMLPYFGLRLLTVVNVPFFVFLFHLSGGGVVCVFLRRGKFKETDD